MLCLFYKPGICSLFSLDRAIVSTFKSAGQHGSCWPVTSNFLIVPEKMSLYILVLEDFINMVQMQL